MSIIYYLNNKKQLHKEHVEKIDLINQVRKSDIEKYITNIKTQLSYFDQRTSAYTNRILTDSNSYDDNQKFRHEVSSLVENSSIESIYVTSSKGDIFFPSNLKKTKEQQGVNFFKKKLNPGDLKTLIKPVPYFTISGIYENETNKSSYYCYVFLPINRISSENNGIIIAKLNMKDIHSIIQNKNNEAIESILIKRNINKYIQISPDQSHGELYMMSERFTPEYNHEILTGVKEFDKETSKLSLIEHGEWCILTIMHEDILFKSSNALLRNTIILSVAFTFLIIVFFIFYSKAIIVNPLNKINNTLFDITNGTFSSPIHYGSNDEFSTTFSAINLINSRLLKAEKIINNLNEKEDKYIPISKDDKFNIKLQTLQAYVRQLHLNINQQSWLMRGLIKHSEILHQHGASDLNELSQSIINSISKYTGVQVGNLYINKDSKLSLEACYGSLLDKNLKYDFGEGLVGECGESKKTIQTIFQQNNVEISSGLGKTNENHILLVPLITYDKVIGIIELCSISPISPLKVQLVETLSENITHTINTFDY